MVHQILIYGSNQKEIENQISLKSKEGYKLVTGSTYICRHAIKADEDTLFTVHMRDNLRDYFIISNNLQDFIKQIQNRLQTYCSVITGSFYVKYFDYKDTSTTITTTLFCLMER